MRKLDFTFIHDGQIHFRYTQSHINTWKTLMLLWIILRGKPVHFIADPSDTIISKGDKVYDFRSINE